jgi:hypothetical protein
MIKIVEELIELVPLFESWLLGDDLVVCRIKAGSEPAKHSGDTQVVLVVAVEGSGIEHNCSENTKCKESSA